MTQNESQRQSPPNTTLAQNPEPKTQNPAPKTQNPPSTQSPAPSYHDYFIKDGRFIGRFEDMYRDVDDPWHIDRLGRRLDMDAALLLLKHSNRRFERALDVGCGKGFFSHLLREAVEGKIFATDVSPTAIARAREKYGDERLEFFSFDLNEINTMPFEAGSFDLIVMAQTIWCILPALKDILQAFHGLLSPSGALLISQHFLKPENQKYGREILSSPEGLIEMLDKAGFEVEATLETNRHSNHHVAVLAGVKAQG